MIALALRYWHIVIIAALVALLGVQQVRVSSARSDATEARAALASDRATYAQAAQVAETTARAEETRRAESTRQTIEDAYAQIQTAQANAASAGRAADGLRQRVAALVAAARQSSGNPAPTGRGSGEQADDAIGVLAHLLGRADDRAGIVAGYADRLRIAGSACERFTDGLTP